MIRVYLETGARRSFAGALEWPGWCRSRRDEGSALEALLIYAPRFQAAIGSAVRGFTAPASAAELKVAERLDGNATTDFGAPAMPPAADSRPAEAADLEKLHAILRACWDAFDRSAAAASGADLRKGPRGGGRNLEAIVAHVLDAERMYLARLGGARPKGAGMADEREAFLDALARRAGGAPPARASRSVPWTPRYAVRRSAWHVLDHAWEIEDRAAPA
ncbi:MAG: hypothetical protein HY775_11120 [Acidobacteria bacterium]|nr:hypothetical protein [Acidobacteriota bacterium]